MGRYGRQWGCDMANDKTDRDVVKEFFEWQWPVERSNDQLKKGIGVIAAGLLFMGLFSGANHSDVARAAVVGSLLVIFFGMFLIYDHYMTSDLLRTPVGKNLAKVHESKFRDLANIWKRSYRRIDKGIADLRQFDLMDYDPLNGARVDFESLIQSPAPFSEIRSRSVCLFGPIPIQESKIQIGVSRNGPTIEFNPVSVSILYIAANQLIVYRAIADLITGDLRSESIQRIYLPQIVQVGVRTDSKRENNPDLLKMFNRARSLQVKELVLSETLIHITMTDGRALELPIGALSVQDGTKGELDRDDVSENREVRIARALDQNIESAKLIVLPRTDSVADGAS
jgi:hypothetical protein